MIGLSRRQFSSALGASALVAGTAAKAVTAKTKPAGDGVAAANRKEWARDKFKGMINILPPSMTPDFKNIDDEGIRNDVRLAVAQGFFATLCSQYTVGIDRAQQKRVVEVACQEGRGKIEVGTAIIEPLDIALELTAHAEKAGCSHILLIAPPPLYKDSYESLYKFYKTVADSTSMGIVLQYYHDRQMQKWHPGGMPIDLFERIADIPNVVALKLTQIIDPGLAYELGSTIGKKVLIGSAEMNLVPLLSQTCKTQWAGMFGADCIQAPSKPYAVEFMRAIVANDMDKAMKLYWAFQPAGKAFDDMQTPSLAKGGHPWQQIKYAKWLVGGNGGLIRNPTIGENAGILPVVDDVSMPPLDAASRERIKAVYRQIGVKLEERPEEEFLVGRAAYARGVRAKDLTERFAYK